MCLQWNPHAQTLHNSEMADSRVGFYLLLVASTKRPFFVQSILGTSGVVIVMEKYTRGSMIC
jgi:hypothetical protein